MMKTMPDYRDVGAFDARAKTYESGWLGRLHHDIADRVLEIALALTPDPERVLDIGCGTGYFLRRLAAQAPEARELVGIDPAPLMIEAARANAQDDHTVFRRAMAEELPFGEASFDLVVAVTSFDHWGDQRLGIREVVRVLEPGGNFVVADVLSAWLSPSLLVGRHGRVRTVKQATTLLKDAGLRVVGERSMHVVIRAIASRK